MLSILRVAFFVRKGAPGRFPPKLHLLPTPLYVTKNFGNARDLTEEYNLSNENRLRQLKISLQKRLATLKSLDEEILDAVEADEAITAEIDESGKFGEQIHGAIVGIDSFLSTTQHTVAE